MRAPTNTRGYLLVEMLAAVILIGVAAAALIPSIINQSQSADRRSIDHRILDLDRRARALALREGPVVLRLESKEYEVHMITDSGSVIVTMFERVELGFTDSEGTPIEQIMIDRFGRSSSYRIRVGIDDAQFELSINGLTGNRQESEDAHG